MAAPDQTLIWVIFCLVAGAAALFVGYLVFDWIRARLRRIAHHRHR